MKLFKRRQPAPAAAPVPGTRYEGPVAYTEDYEAVERPGFYALTEDGKAHLFPLLRLVWVDDAPGDASDGSGHYEVAGPKDGPVRRGNVVTLKAEAQSGSEIGAQAA